MDQEKVCEVSPIKIGMKKCEWLYLLEISMITISKLILLLWNFR